MDGGSVQATGITDSRLRNLWRWNLGLTVLHAAQAVAVLAARQRLRHHRHLDLPRGPARAPRRPPPEALFDVRIGVAVAVFLGLAALDHLLTATWLRARYEHDLRARHQPVPVGRVLLQRHAHGAAHRLYSGITDITARDRHRRRQRRDDPVRLAAGAVNPPGAPATTMVPFWFGTIAGVAPWMAIAVNIIGADQVPGFVYGIFVAQLVFFFSFGLNQWLQYREIGPWPDYAFGEKAYLVLSLGAKSVLAWQIFAGSLAG